MVFFAGFRIALEPQAQAFVGGKQRAVVGVEKRIDFGEGAKRVAPHSLILVAWRRGLSPPFLLRFQLPYRRNYLSDARNATTSANS